MWTIAGMLVVLVAAIRSGSYILWLWAQGERKASLGAALLTALSIALPVFAVVRSNR